MTRSGQEAAPATPGTVEHVCPHCKGRGQHDGVRCPVCGGSGRVIEDLAGGRDSLTGST